MCGVIWVEIFLADTCVVLHAVGIDTFWAASRCYTSIVFVEVGRFIALTDIWFDARSVNTFDAAKW